jgi:NADH-quinone oxidoreductase subunit A
MPAAYIPGFLFALLVIFVPVLCLIFLRHRQRDAGQDGAERQSLESDLATKSFAPGGYSTQLYFVAALFVIFDVATIFLFAWAILFRGWMSAHQGAFAMALMVVFLAVLTVGYVWVAKKGALDEG